MQLIRFALISLDGAAEDWNAFTVEHDGVTASAIQSWSKPPGLLILVAASVALDEPPVSDTSGVVEVPDTPRRRAEAAIEVAANAVSIATGHRRTLLSPALPVAFRSENAAERAWLSAQSTLATAGKGTAAGRVLVKLDEHDINALTDRDAGVALMAEVLEQRHEPGSGSCSCCSSRPSRHRLGGSSTRSQSSSRNGPAWTTPRRRSSRG